MTVQGTEGLVNEYDDNISAINAATNQLFATLAGREGLISDKTSSQLPGVVPNGMGAAHIAFSPDGKTAYLSNGGDNSVTAIDVESMKVIAIISLSGYPHSLRSSSDGKCV